MGRGGGEQDSAGAFVPGGGGVGVLRAADRVRVQGGADGHREHCAVLLRVFAEGILDFYEGVPVALALQY